MDIKSYIQDQYAQAKDGIEADFAGLMKSAQTDFDARMDSYAAMRNAAIKRLQSQYGMTVSPDGDTPKPAN